MNQIFNSIDQLVGGTPLLQLNRYTEAQQLPTPIIAKLEYLNPTGSAKDRAALYMVNQAEASGQLAPGGTLIEPTSGNTGIGLAALAAARGYRMILTMPDTMSQERRTMLAAYGAELVLTPGAQGMDGAVKRAEELAQEIAGSVIPGQFTNPANPQAHYETTGPEIWRDTQGQVDVLVAGIGTGGTITGTARYLKEQNPSLHVVAVEPAGSPLLSQGQAGPHKIQGIGANFVPQALDTTIYDQIIAVENEDAFQQTRTLARTEGVLVGISSGAALAAASQIAREAQFMGKTIVVVLPDSGDRYLSAGVF